MACMIYMLSLTACYRMIDTNYDRSPHTLDNSKSYAVVQLPEDHGKIGQAILDEMTLRGARVRLVDEGYDRRGVDILIRYEAAWGWDITWYLLALSISVYDAKSDALLVASAQYRTSLVRSSSAEAAAVLLERVFGGEQLSEVNE